MDNSNEPMTNDAVDPADEVEIEDPVADVSERAAVVENADAEDGAAESEEPFDAPVRTDPETGEVDVDALVINLDGYAGPLDVLLDLARSQKVDLRKISMLALVEQYLAFVEAAKARRLELAADYLVMAAWLAFLKSKLLLPTADEDSEEPTADEMAARLAFQLQRLEAMRKASENIFNLPRMGENFFTRGAPEGVQVVKKSEWRADLYDLLQAYAKQRVSTIDRSYKIDPPKVMTIEQARERLARMLGAIPDWVELRSLVQITEDVDAPPASVVASNFNAALEFAKNGKIDLRQLGHYEPIYVRAKKLENADPSDAASINEVRA